MGKLGRVSRSVLFFLVFSLLSVYIIHSAPDSPSITFIKNATAIYDNGTMQNRSRGYIYTININHSQPTMKWIGYVGNITGEFGLIDSNAYSLYDWDMTTTTGEVYATKEGPGPDSPGTCDGENGGIPDWSQMVCTDAGNITQEEKLLNHTPGKEDSYTNTFAGGVHFSTFYAGSTLVSNSSTCYGLHLNQNNSDVSNSANTPWAELVLMDGTNEQECSSTYGSMAYQWDIIYAVMIQNNTYGFDYTPYDFQIIIPQSGLDGTQNNIPFYFYVELV